ncbi:MAG: phosphate ABC transporter substrate-binding protein PstS family protein [Streptosporangiales bacterium]|nr:phosphate ABC transporter substrate-binding protein PstS family protein [Streptosporangiales bacterium]
MIIRHSKRARFAAVFVTAGLALAACGGGGGSSGGSDDEGKELSGTVLLDGSSTVAPLGEAAAELFMEENPNVKVTVGTAGTGGGFEKFCAGETDISNASRPIEDDETKVCKSNAVAHEELAVANDALTVMVHKDNPVSCLTTEQLTQIWEPGSTVKNWSEIDGLEENFNAPLDLYGPGTDSGTFDYFTEAINGEEGVQRKQYNNIGENDNAGITGVSGSKGGMFYAGFSYYEENKDKAKALQIDGGDGCVEPSLKTVKDATYTPLGRELFMYPSDKALEKPQVVAFLEFYIANQKKITEAAGYIDLTDEQVKKSQKKIDELAG